MELNPIFFVLLGLRLSSLVFNIDPGRYLCMRDKLKSSFENSKLDEIFAEGMCQIEAM